MTRELLFSITASDCRFDYFRGGGKGGQKRNKTSSGVRCNHDPSGAVGRSDDTRSQHKNKRIAFGRMARSKEFNAWHKIEVARRTGALQEASDWADREMKRNIKVDVQEDGIWIAEAPNE